MKMKKIIALLLLFGFVVVAIQYLKSDFQKAPPTLYFNGNIITVDDKQPLATAMLVVDGIIEAIGDSASIDYAGIKNIQKRDLKGANVLPGFIDVHTHFALSMFMSAMHDLSGFKHDTNKALWQHFEDLTKNAVDGEWLIFKGLDPILVEDLELPTMAYLDSIAPNNPVVIFSQSLHSYLANSKAFEKAGISTTTPNHSSHSFYQRDSLGNFTGLIVEQEALVETKSLLGIFRKEKNPICSKAVK